ncbi:hypothetical protein ACWATR_38475 [Nostoc sp. UIC 10890]
MTATNFLFTNSHALKYSLLLSKTFRQFWRTVRRILLLFVWEKNNIIVIACIPKTLFFSGIAPD